MNRFHMDITLMVIPFEIFVGEWYCTHDVILYWASFFERMGGRRAHVQRLVSLLRISKALSTVHVCNHCSSHGNTAKPVFNCRSRRVRLDLVEGGDEASGQCLGVLPSSRQSFGLLFCLSKLMKEAELEGDLYDVHLTEERFD
jgi:hypothetical protein